jgi:6-phosphofructokinase 1
VPKTIDNDVPYVWMSFGFNTAIERATEIIRCAAVEARSYKNCLAIVKLMGRQAGFVAAWASVAAQCVDLTLIPEMDVEMEKVIARIKECFKKQSSAVIVVAEGAGQSLCSQSQDGGRDPSGNPKLADIGSFLRDKLMERFRSEGTEILIRYLDPAYAIRAVPANNTDALLCDGFARAAVHAAMAGKTDLLIGLWYNNLTHVPLPLAIKEQKRISPGQDLWRAVLAANS